MGTDKEERSEDMMQNIQVDLAAAALQQNLTCVGWQADGCCSGGLCVVLGCGAGRAWGEL